MARNGRIHSKSGKLPASASAGPEDSRPPGALDRALQDLVSLGDLAGHLAATRVDRARTQVRWLVWKTWIIVAVSIAAVGAMLIVWKLLIHGVAGGLAIALGERAWLGDFLAGALGLAVIVGMIVLAVHRLRAASFRDMVAKYERRKARHKSRVAKPDSNRTRAANRAGLPPR